MRELEGSGDPAPLDEAVLEVLSSLILFKNRADARGWRDAFENMPVYMERIGLTPTAISKLRVIHVAGTKGKGSTCAMVESILRRCGYRTGLFTSPHLVDIRERVRINGQMVTKTDFEAHFWDCYDHFKTSATPEVGVPGFFRFITLLALKMFLDQGVDVVVLEVGVGGRLDATNVIPRPVVCGITPLGFDHMDMLGDTLPKIAREKAGILKPGRPGFTVQQPPDAFEALQEVAEAVGADLHVSPALDHWKSPGVADVAERVALGGQHQVINAGLAVRLCEAFEAQSAADGCAAPGAATRLAELKQRLLPADYGAGLQATQWPGRSQVVQDAEFQAAGLGEGAAGGPSRLSFFIDGAHTPESMVTCAEWFAAAAAAQAPAPGTSAVERVLLFNCMKEREPTALLPLLSSTLLGRGVRIAHALFAPPQSQYGFLATRRKPVPDKEVADTAAAAQAAAAARAPPVDAHGATAEAAPVEYAWQAQLQQCWTQHCATGHSGAASAGASPSPLFPFAPGLPVQSTNTGAVAQSLDATLQWLRGRARSQPQLQLQVLVTGSLYLVGDVLRLLGKAPK